MLHHYLLVAIRNLTRNKIFVAINVLSLTFALTCCILSYVNYAYRNEFNQNYSQTEKVYRINSIRKVQERLEPWAIVPLALSTTLEQELKEDSPLAKLATASAVVKSVDKVFNEQVHYIDKDFFTIFNMPLKEGTLNSLDKSKIILSTELAKRYFGAEFAVGKNLVIIRDGKEKAYEVGAVLGSIPLNSSFQFNIVTLFDNFFDTINNEYSWKNENQITAFIRFNNLSEKSAVEEKLVKQANIYNTAQDKIIVNKFYLQPFQELAVTSDVDMPGYIHGNMLNSNPRGVIVIGPIIISTLILIIASFNFINTTIASAGSRLKEIGVRKVLGGLRMQLIKQFVLENLMLCLVTLLISVIVAELLLPVINQLLVIQLDIQYSNDFAFFSFLFTLAFATAFISGLYPAYFISSFKPLTILKGKTKFSSGVVNRILLTLQFTIATFALVVGIVMTQNATYQETAPLGYDINMVGVTMVDNKQQYDLLYNALHQHPKIKAIAGTQKQLGAGGSYTTKIGYRGNENEVQLLNVGKDYLKLMGVPIINGQYFDAEKESDYQNAVLINETLARELGIAEANDQELTIDNRINYVIGIIKDYHEFGNHGLIPPMVFKATPPTAFAYLNFRVNEEEELLMMNEYVKTIWKKLVPDKPYQGFLQEDMMEKEVRLSKGFKNVSLSLAVVTILLSAGGLYSLVSLNILKRLKEIAIRKVLGSPVIKIVAFLNKELIRIIITAFIFGSALAFVVVDKLIFKFIYAYHTSLTTTPFILALTLIVLSAGLITGVKIIRAANTNPAVVLKNE